MDRLRIQTDYGVRRVLARKFKTSDVTVRNSLKFVSKSWLSHQIREEALKEGGTLKGAVSLEEAERAVGCEFARPDKPVKVLDAHGNVTRVINE